jgi:hypothetical protein
MLLEWRTEIFHARGHQTSPDQHIEIFGIGQRYVARQAEFGSVPGGSEYLVDQEKFRPTDALNYGFRSLVINGQTYAQSVCFYLNQRGFATIVLGRKYTRLQAAIGIDDEANANLRARFEVSADNTMLLRRDMAKGEVFHVDVDVTNVYSITITATRIADGGGYATFGDARVLAKA